MSNQWMKLLAVALLLGGCKKTVAPDPAAQIVSKRGPRLGFHLSDADPEKPEARTTVKGKPLGEAETAALLARLPPPAASAPALAASFALRQASLPAPRPGRTVAESFPPPTVAPVPTVPTGALTVTRKAPEGDVEHAPNVSVTFSQPMVELSTQGELAGKTPPLTLTPKPEGSFRWLGTQTLAFQPDKEFPKSTEYVVEIPAGTRSLSGAKTDHAERFVFSTPTVKLVDHSREDNVGRSPVLVAEFDQRIDTAKFLAAVELEVDDDPADGVGRKRPVRLATSAEIQAEPSLRDRIEAIERKGKDRVLVFKPRAPLPSASRFVVEFPAGLSSLEGPRATTEPQRWSFRTYGNLTIERVACQVDACRPNSSFDATFSNPIDSKTFDKSMVKVEPAPTNLRVAVSSGNVDVWAHWKANTRYTVTFAKSIRDRWGQTLGTDIVKSFNVSPFEPNILGGKQMSVADPGTLATSPGNGKPAYSLFSTNLAPSRVRVIRVGPEDYGRFVAFTQTWQEKLLSLGEYAKLPNPPGTVVVDRDLVTDGVLDDVSETLIDLAPALHGDVGQVIVLVQPKVWHEKTRFTQFLHEWVQVTRIGISSFEAGDGGLSLLATGLQRAEPLAGVTFSVLGTGYAATTGTDGNARIGGPVPGQRPDGILVARRGEDSAFVPGLYGNKGGSEAETSLFTFDDRELYKPGETVRIKGLLRSLGQRRGGDVSLPPRLVGAAISYVVSDARGAQIAKGGATSDDHGGLFVSFVLPDNANLGAASVLFSGLGNDYLGNERFEIQEFRRPEFEVSAEVEPGPLVVGEFGVAAAKAVYYSGGGVRAAETDWRVTRQTAAFSPPNRSDYKFGKNEVYSFGWYAQSYEPAHEAVWKGRTDLAGTHRMRVDFDGSGEPYPMTLSLAADVHDMNSQTWSASTTMLVHPARVYAGLKLGKPFVKAGDPIELDVIATDLEGVLVAGRHVHLRSNRVESEQIKGEWVEHDVDVAECDFVSRDAAAPKACSLATRGGGRYFVVAEVTDDKGRLSRTTLYLWALGAGHGAERDLRASRLELELDKDKYAPGDHAELLIKSRFAPAIALLEVVGGAAPREQRFAIESTTQTLDVPVLPGDAPGLLLRVSMVGSEPRRDEHGEIDAKAPPQPAWSESEIHLAVPPTDRELKVLVGGKEPVLRPGADATITIDVTGASKGPVEAAVFVVDESILALTGYTLRNPMDAFYNDVGRLSISRDLRSYVSLARGDQLRRIFAASDGEGRDPNAPTAPWGRDVGDTFGAAGLGLSGMGEGGGGRGEGIGLGNIGTIGHGSGQGFGSGAARAPAPSMRPGQATAAPSKPTSAVATDANKMGAAEFGMIGLLSNAPSDPWKQSPAIRLRSNFAALAFYEGRVKTDAAGHAQLTVKMPDSTSRFRIMAVAWDTERSFGKGESTLTLRQPITVRPSAPRFLNYGDRFELPVIVQNQSDQPVQVSIAGRASNATFAESLGRTFAVAAGDRVEVRMPAAAAMPGTAHFDFAVAATEPGAAEFTDAAHVELPVWTPGTTEAFATYGNLDEPKEDVVGQAVRIPDSIDKNWGGLDISTSSTALFALSDAMLNLTRYPFECNEQLASRVLAVSTLRDMMKAFASSELPSADALNASVAKDLKLLAGRQDKSNGGFGFWVRDAWPYLSVHVAFALSTAKQKGYPVDLDMLASVQQYLVRIDSYIPSYYGPEARRSLRAYALFVLRRLGAPNPELAASLARETPLEQAPIESLAWLLPTLAGNPGTQGIAADIQKHFENRAVETSGAAHFTSSYGESDYLVLSSTHRSDALVLLALIETQPQNPLIPKVVAGLLGNRKKGHWQNTQEDAFVLLALDAYFRKFENVTPSFVARVWLGDKAASEHTFRGYNTDRVETSVPMADLAALGASTLVVQKEGAGRLYYRVGLRYAPSDLRLPPLERGFSVLRRYEAATPGGSITRDDKGVWHVKVGTLVRVRISMVATSERHHVALVDPMPAGFEAQNASLLGTPAIPVDRNEKPHEYWTSTWYEHENLRDERAEAFTSMLWAGTHEYVYTARATTPGSFVVPPAKAEEMYAPETFGRSAGDQVVVE